ncbi:dynein axonemal light chain 1-like [Anabrus simplex]|uniref:dynein axonemal light chain 1-like n=1 Tax=Anabrus simplex TaxID=316456 RepID=UPI0035A29508
MASKQKSVCGSCNENIQLKEDFIICDGCGLQWYGKVQFDCSQLEKPDSIKKSDIRPNVEGTKGTSLKEAIQRWQEKTGQNPSEATEVMLYFQWPPIQVLDNSFSMIPKCEKLSLSTNMIEKVAGMAHLSHLRILSIGRNYIKNFAGLEAVANTLEELWISYNLIERMKGVGLLKKLKVLYMGNNLVKDWSEFKQLQEVTTLEDLLFDGNPLCEASEESVWKAEIIKRLPNLKKLDGDTVIRAEED